MHLALTEHFLHAMMAKSPIRVQEVTYPLVGLLSDYGSPQDHDNYDSYLTLSVSSGKVMARMDHEWVNGRWKEVKSGLGEEKAMGNIWRGGSWWQKNMLDRHYGQNPE